MIYGIDLGHPTVQEAEHWLRETAAGLGPDVVACTHLITGPHPRVAISLTTPGDWPPPIDPEIVTRVTSLHASRQGGRAVRFPGLENLRGTLSVADLIGSSAIDEVRVLGTPSPLPDPATLVDTRDFVRPQYFGGRLVLMATPAPDGHIAPFEVPHPTPCCAFH
jgi:hypothetical protein